MEPDAADQPPTHAERIVVLALSALGDLILSLPLLGEARRIYRNARFTFVCQRPAVAAFARELGVAEEVVALPPTGRRSPVALCRSLRRMRLLRADITLQSFASHGSFGNLIAGATGAAICCGFESGRFQNRLTHRIPVRPDKHLIDLNLDLLRRLGHREVRNPVSRFLPRIEERSARWPAGSLTARYGPYLVISVGSDPTLAFKRWPAEKWARLTRRLAADGLTCVFIGHRSECEGIDRILAMADGAGVNLAGETDFADLAAVIASSLGVVATDGMPLHFAAALGKTCVGIFGPTHPDIGGPWGPLHENVYLELPCSPCYGSLTVGKTIACTTHECLRYLPVEEVYQKVLKMLHATLPPVPSRVLSSRAE
ncbi:MAG TPA: glycosyltransferase family 9 protein [Chthonomonadaceae bacterium]|nr:glycosyltransferase family 9 protein [Chthonomonadaceae bacterium]